mgnify:FL=1
MMPDNGKVNKLLKTSRSHSTNRVLLGDLDDQKQENIKSTIDDLDATRLLTEENGVRFTLVAVPVSAQVTTTFPGQKYQSTLEQYADAAGMDYIDLLPDLRSHHEKHRESLVIPFDGHYNKPGHRVMAISVFSHMDTTGLREQ